MNFNTRKPKPEHLDKLTKLLQIESDLSPNEIIKKTDLTLTATYGAIEELERQNKIITIRQKQTPKLRVRLK